MSVKSMAFSVIALALLMSVTAFASGNSFLDSAREFFGLQTNAATVEMNAQPAAVTSSVLAPCAGPGLGDIRTVSMPTITATPGAITVPITVGDLTNCAVISYDLNVDYDPLVLSVSGAGVNSAGTLSSTMIVTPNTLNSGHLIVSAFQATPLCPSGCVGGETLLNLTFNIIGAPGSSSPLTFADYTDPLPAFHPAFTFNDGDPDDTDTNGSVTVPALPTATSTNTNTPTPTATNTFTPTNTSTPTNTATATATQTNTFTPTPTPLCAQIDIDDKTVTAGGPVTLSVMTSNTSVLTPTAFSADFHISFDNTVLQEDTFANNYGVTLGTVGAGSLLTVNHQISGSTTTLFISLYNDLGFSGAGSLVDLNFLNVTGAPGTFSPVTFTPFSLNGVSVPLGFWYNEDPNGSCVNDGSVSISGTISGRVRYANEILTPTNRWISGVTITGTGFPTFSNPTVTGVTNSNGIYSLTGFGMGNYTMVPSRAPFSAPNTHGSSISTYDAALVARAAVGLVTLNPVQTSVAKVSGDPSVSSFDASKIARWAVNIADTGFSGDWRFQASSNFHTFVSNITNEDYLGYLMGEVSGNWCDPGATTLPCNANGTTGVAPRGVNGPQRATNVETAKVSAPTGSEVVVPVTVQGVADRGIISYQFDVRYDSTLIQPAANAVTLNDTVSSGMTVVFNTATPGLMRVGVYGIADLAEAGTLLNLHFKAIGAPFSTSPITMENFMFNEGGIKMTIIDGEVRLMPAVPVNAD